MQIRQKGAAYQNRKPCCFIAVDVQNAFNSVPRVGIIKGLERKHTLKYRLNMVKSCLNGRFHQVADAKFRVTCGVP